MGEYKKYTKQNVCDKEIKQQLTQPNIKKYTSSNLWKYQIRCSTLRFFSTQSYPNWFLYNAFRLLLLYPLWETSSCHHFGAELCLTAANTHPWMLNCIKKQNNKITKTDQWQKKQKPKQTNTIQPKTRINQNTNMNCDTRVHLHRLPSSAICRVQRQPRSINCNLHTFLCQCY